ncbi:MAG TPA: DNA-directed RNA polymerase subunit beta [Aggregatilineales bacterium]|nr:DNA-directed RNA polymerase subunit beta [Anaerolineales bacterium]HRE48785.1 DNA-directed RNA polymerase subunit beta [Aggregatilineales bacterium]
MKKRLDTKNYARTHDVQELPSLIEVQLQSFEWFKTDGMGELFSEISPIESYNGSLKLYFPGPQPETDEFGLKYWFEDPKHSEELCLERDMTYSAPLYVRVALVNKETDEILVNDIFLGDFPLMTENGTFIINGIERVVVSQLIRSPGVYFDVAEERTTGRNLSNAKLIPDRGAWMEFETRKSDYITVKFNRKRTVPVTILLRALAAVSDDHDDLSPIRTGSDEELLAIFKDVDDADDHHYLEATIKNEPQWDIKEGRTIGEMALLEFFKRMRPGDPPNLDNAREYLRQQLFDQRRYDLERVGRYKLNQRMGLDTIIDRKIRTVTKYDLVKVVERMIMINNRKAEPDDIDHLGNRRVKTVGELIQSKLRVGLRRTERVIRERMTMKEADRITPVTLINIRPIVAAVREFFGSSQLSQFMEQTNPLAELTHKRTLSALGPGGLRRERAGFDVRDVHHSHYGRICPIETPEGPNIGLIGRLATYARVNPYGFIETPYRKVVKELALNDERLFGRQLSEDLTNADDEVIVEEGTVITEGLLKKFKQMKMKTVPVRPFVSGETVYLSADEEDRFMIAQANATLDEHSQFTGDRISSRFHQKFLDTTPNRIDYMDVAPRQIVGISAALIPFLEHDDANRALMGSNMQRQAVPLLNPDVPIVSTGMEDQAAYDSGQVLLAEAAGEVISVTGDKVVVKDDSGDLREYRLRKYTRSNQSTCIDQRPVVEKGQRVNRRDVIADSSSTKSGNLALGHDVVCAFLSWEGGNYEDALLISERLLREDMFTSIHIEKHEIEARDTKLGPEEITYDIPNVGEEALKDLNEDGIVRIGAEVGPNDILVGKITPKGEKELSPEEKLLRAIFGEKAREVKDTSLRLPHGERGKVVDVKIFNREEHRDLPAGVEQMVRVSVAQRRKLTQGDKMAGRHGNKGVISKVVPLEDMPYLEDGTPIDIILNPLGVPGRMNIGQVLETHLGWAAGQLGFRAVTPVFDGAEEREIEAELGRAWLIDYTWEAITERAWAWINPQGYSEEELEDDEEVRRLFVSDWLAGKPDYDSDLLMLEHIYLRRSVLREWVREQGWNPDDVLIFDNTGMSSAERDRIDANAIDLTLYVWTAFASGEETPAGLSREELREYAHRISIRTGLPVPIYGKQMLYDGKTGQPYDRPVTIGVIHMLKLAHLVEDKVHARSTGPYSLVTQQPLGGKAQFGGQRFGEMEVWALEAYGAAYTLQEMLTVKSDDVQGRVKTYEAIVKGDPIEEPGIPASFRVLVKELQSLGLAVEAITEAGDVITFGREREDNRQPNIKTGLFGLEPNRQGN